MLAMMESSAGDSTSGDVWRCRRRSGGFLSARLRPALRLRSRHVAHGTDARVLVAPALQVGEVLRARQDRALADAPGIGHGQLALEPAHQVLDDAGWNGRPLARIDEAEEHEVAEQD